MQTHRQSIEYAQKVHNMFMNEQKRVVDIAHELDILPSKVSAEVRRYIDYLQRLENPVFAAIIEHCNDMPVSITNGIIKALSWQFREVTSITRPYEYRVNLTPQKFMKMTEKDIMNLRGIGQLKGSIILEIQEKFKRNSRRNIRMKHNHVNEMSTWCKKFLSQADSQDKITQLSEEIKGRGAVFINACAAYYTSECTLKEIGDCLNVTPQRASQYVYAGYVIMRRELSDEAQFAFYQDFKRQWNALGIHNYPLLRRIYKALEHRGITSMDQLIDAPVSYLSTIQGVGPKSLDYLISIQWNLKNEHKLGQVNEIELTVHPVRNL